MEEPIKRPVEKIRLEILKHIEDCGCSVIHTGSSDAPYTYSVGVEFTTGQPDIVIAGADARVAQTIINNYCSLAKKGETFECDKPYDKFIISLGIFFKPVLKKHYKKFNALNWFNSGTSHYNIWQLVLPDKVGKFPWEINFSKKLMAIQKLYY